MKTGMRYALVVLGPVALGLAVVVAPALAQIVAPAGRTLFNQGVLVRTLVRYDTFDEVAPGDEVERFSTIWAVVWGARPHLSLSLVTPVVRLDASAASGDRSRTGTADTTLFARYDAFRRTRPGGYTRLSPEVGVKLPTGAAFGTGSTDLLAGLVFSHVRDPDWWIADVQWTGFGEGDGRLVSGDRWRADLAYLRRILPRNAVGVPMVLLVAELGYQKTGRGRRSGSPVAGSGGHVLSFSPGIEWIVSRRIVLELAAPIVIDADLRGDQPQPEASLILGSRWLF